MLNKKNLYIIIIIILVGVVLGISYAWFSAIISGNASATTNKVVTGDLELTYTDTNEISLDNAVPGSSFTKIISVKNTGNLKANYSIIWQELNNEIINDELVIEFSCKRLNSSNIEEGTCNGMEQTAVNSNTIKSNISIESGITHEYSIKVTFIDTGKEQNYNKSKSFNGKLGIENFEVPVSVSFAEDSWKTISTLVQSNEISNYKVGDTKTIELDGYGTHTVRITNTSTPSECGNSGFSQTACGFVIEFADIISMKSANSTDTNVGGWPSSSMRTFLNNDIYNSLPTDLKNVIIGTTVVSGCGNGDPGNFTSIDKLYLFSPGEIYANYSNSSYDSAIAVTRQLDYYKSLNISVSNYNGVGKKYNNSNTWAWLRTAVANGSTAFCSVGSNGDAGQGNASSGRGLSPAFKIG